MAIINRGGNTPSFAGTVIAVDAQTQTIKFCSAEENGELVFKDPVSFSASSFDKEFFETLADIAWHVIEKNPDMDVQKISLVLPDTLFLIDTLNVPVIHKKAMQQSLSLAIEAIYKNAEDLSLMTYGIQQNKQVATYGIVGIRRDVLGFLNDAFDNVGLPISGITYSSSSMSNAVMALNGKLKNDTFLLLDIKEGVSRFAFVVRGCTMGYYELPFGYEIMSRSRLITEESLFDHRAGKLLILNSKEKARAKQLTADAEAFDINDEDTSEIDLQHDSESYKGTKKLPQFMQRPTPQNDEEFIYENFRVFLKWALELINNNRDITALSKLDTVYINMPAKFKFLFDVINKKHAGRGIAFAPPLSDDCELMVAENLELYGGLHIGRYNEANTF